MAVTFLGLGEHGVGADGNGDEPNIVPAAAVAGKCSQHRPFLPVSEIMLDTFWMQFSSFSVLPCHGVLLSGSRFSSRSSSKSRSSRIRSALTCPVLGSPDFGATPETRRSGQKNHPISPKDATSEERALRFLDWRRATAMAAETHLQTPAFLAFFCFSTFPLYFSSTDSFVSCMRCSQYLLVNMVWKMNDHYDSS